MKVFAGGQLESEAVHSLASGQWLPSRIDVTDGSAATTNIDVVDAQVDACLVD